MTTKKITILVFTMACVTTSVAQKIFTDCTGVKRYYAKAGERITFTCDSVLLLNLNSYRTLDSAYVHLRAITLSMALNTDSANRFNSLLLENKSAQHQLLKRQFVDLGESTSLFTNEVTTKLKQVDNHLATAMMKISIADHSVDVAASNLRKLKRRKKTGVVISGLIGFGVGSLFTSVIK